MTGHVPVPGLNSRGWPALPVPAALRHIAAAGKALLQKHARSGWMLEVSTCTYGTAAFLLALPSGPQPEQVSLCLEPKMWCFDGSFSPQAG